MIKNILLIFALFCTSLYANASTTGTTKINRIVSYTNHGNGDVIFTVKSPISACTGYWLSKDDSGFNANLSMIIAAFQSQSNLIISGDSDEEQKWTGSTSSYCKLESVDYRL